MPRSDEQDYDMDDPTIGGQFESEDEANEDVWMLDDTDDDDDEAEPEVKYEDGLTRAYAEFGIDSYTS